MSIIPKSRLGRVLLVIGLFLLVLVATTIVFGAGEEVPGRLEDILPTTS